MVEKKTMSSREIATLKRELKELTKRYETLRSFVGYDELEGWLPKKDVETQYGWLHAWMYPLYSHLITIEGVIFSPDHRNKIVSLVRAIIAQIAISDKYGVKLPLEPKDVDTENFEKKQRSYYELDYGPCEICGEDRITHECHIIPRSEGGPNHRDNFVTLCPLHHHLFDNHRLNQEEWKTLRTSIENKMPSAVIYANEVHQKILLEYWANPKKSYPYDNDRFGY